MPAFDATAESPVASFTSIQVVDCPCCPVGVLVPCCPDRTLPIVLNVTIVVIPNLTEPPRISCSADGSTFKMFLEQGDGLPPSPPHFCVLPIGSQVQGPDADCPSGSVVAKWSGFFSSGPLGPGGFPIQFNLCLACAQCVDNLSRYFFFAISRTAVCDGINPGTRFYVEGLTPTEFFQVSCQPFMVNMVLNAPPLFGEDTIRAIITE